MVGRVDIYQLTCRNSSLRPRSLLTGPTATMHSHHLQSSSSMQVYQYASQTPQLEEM